MYDVAPDFGLQMITPFEYHLQDVDVCKNTPLLTILVPLSSD
jgi:hypothetical protein